MAGRAQGKQPAENRCWKSKDENELNVDGMLGMSWGRGLRLKAAAALGKALESNLRVDFIPITKAARHRAWLLWENWMGLRLEAEI